MLTGKHLIAGNWTPGEAYFKSSPATGAAPTMTTHELLAILDAVPEIGAASSVIAPVPAEMTGASSVPVTVIFTVVVEPSLSATVKFSTTTWPPASASARASRV